MHAGRCFGQRPVCLLDYMRASCGPVPGRDAGYLFATGDAMATDAVVPAEDRYAAFDAAVNAHRSEADKQEAGERGELPRSQAPKAPRLLRWIDVPEYEGFQ